MIGPRCQRATISCPLAARIAIPTAKDSQNARAIHSSFSRDRIANPPVRMIPSASAIHHDIGPHQKSSGSARVRPSSEEAEDEAEVRRVEDVVPAPLDEVLREERDRGGSGEDPPSAQAPPVAVLRPGDAEDEGDAVPGQERARRPHQDALGAHRDPDLEHGAGHERDEDLRDREPELERDLPEHLQRRDRRGEVQPRVLQLRQQDRIRGAPDDERPAARRGCNLGAHAVRSYFGAASVTIAGMRLEHGFAIVHFVVDEAPAPVSVFVADDHGEIVAAATMDGAAADTRLNAQRKAYTAARSDARSTAELADKVRDDPVERASFDPFFTFFLGGVAAFEGENRVGAVGVSGLPGEVDEQLARRAIEAAGLSFQSS